MSSRFARRLHLTALITIAFLMGVLFPYPAQAAQSDLTFQGVTGTGVQGTTIYVRDGDVAPVTLTVKNVSGHNLQYVTMVDTTTVEQDEQTVTPLVFPPHSSIDQNLGVTNAYWDTWSELTSETTGNAYGGYDIADGATASFEVRVDAGNLAPGTYQLMLQLGKEHSLWEQIMTGGPAGSWAQWVPTGETVVDELYGQQVQLTVVVYTQPDAALAVGENTGTAYAPVITPPASGTLDFGTIDLDTADDAALTVSRTLYAMNMSPRNVLTDVYGNSTSIKVAFGGEATEGDELGYWYSPFSVSNGTLYDTNWEPLPPVTTSGNSTTYQTADSTVFLYATNHIAGTYTGNFVVSTTPHNVRFNGAAGNASGVYRIPFRVELTGTNPRLVPRATDLVATPGNGLVELVWTPPEEAEEYTEYTVCRREGTETQTDPDKLDWSLYEDIGTKALHDEDQLLYVDGDVENGTTYSYTVICGKPYQGYAAAVATATPDASLQVKLMEPYFNVSDGVGCVELSWEMNDAYGGETNDGSGMVDHFNIYRDGMLVDQIYQSAVADEVQYGWISDGQGNSHYGVTRHSYSWSAQEAVPHTFVPYSWTITAVSSSGVEGYPSEAIPAQARSETSSILTHNAWYEPNYYDEATETDVPAILIYADEYGDGDNIDTLSIWRSEGTSAPDTSAAPYATADKFDGYASDRHDFADTNVRAGRTYTYTVRGNLAGGDATDFYTFTVKAVEDVSFRSADVTWSVLASTTARLVWYDDVYHWDDALDDYVYTGVYKVYRNGTLIKTVQNKEWHDVRDDPGSDGTYVYRVDKVVSGVTVRGRDFTFVRATQPVDPESMIKPPDAPTLSGRTSGGSNVILSWTPANTGGAPEGYHIYRSDAGEVQMGGRYVTEMFWNGPREVWTSWGNSRYISLAGADTHAFVDGRVNDDANNDYYQNDTHKGRIEDVDWRDEYLPHVYYITAYNHAGESAPSKTVVFDTHEEDEWGNPVAPAYVSSGAPATPVIDDLWVDWEEYSTLTSGFDPVVVGKLRVAWRDTGMGGDADRWRLTYDGTVWFSSPQTDTLELYKALADPATKLGTSSHAPYCDVLANSGNDGEIDHTLTVTVAAENSAGTATSDAAQLTIRSFPRSYALPDNGGALLRWTDLFNDATTQVTGWEIWRKPAHGIWEQIGTHAATTEYDGMGKDSNNQPVGYYEWADSNLDNGWTYQYKVVAACADGIDRSSRVLEVTPQPTAAVEAPGAPRNLRASVVNGVVNLTWDPPETGGVVSYYIPEVKGGTYDFYNGSIGSVSGNSTSATWMPSSPGTYRFLVWSYTTIDGRDTPGSKYPYQIDGYDDMSEAEQIAAMYPTASNVCELTITQEQIDSRPTGELGDYALTLTPGEHQVSVSWTACENAISYKIERHNNDYPTMPDVTIAAVPGQQTYTYVDETAEPGVRYRYVVYACNAGSGVRYRDDYATATGVTHDQKAAAQVAALIAALPSPGDVSVDDVARIQAVQEAYASLTPAQQARIPAQLVQKLEDCVEAADELALLAQYGDVVAPVQALIDALPDAASVTTADADQIAAARAAYDALTPAEAKRLVSTTRLVEAEGALEALYDQAAAAPVALLLESLPEPEDLALSHETSVQEARAAYDALTDNQKAYVSLELVERLEADEAQIALLRKQAEDQAAADEVTALLEALPDASVLTLADEDDVDAARTALEALTTDQRALVDDALVENLEACEERLPELWQQYYDEQQAAPVIAAIDALPDVQNLTLEDSGAVILARTAYDALSESQKAVVGLERADYLTACEQRINELKAELAQHEAAEQAAYVDGLIEQIGDVTLEREAAIVTAREAYEALSPEACDLVTKLDVLEAAEQDLQALKDAADAAAVDELLDALPEAESVTADDAAQIEAVRAAYDALSEGAKDLVTKLDKLTAAEAALDDLTGRRDEALDTLQELIDQAEEAAQTVVASTNGSDVPTTKTWATQGELDALASALEAAQTVADDDNSTVAELEAAAEALRQALVPVTTGARKGTASVWKRLAGSNSFGTMKAIVDEGWSDGKGGYETGGTVVVATRNGFKDALTAAGVAGLEDAPVLLTNPKGVPDQTRTLLQKMRPSKIYVVGGTVAVSDATKAALEAAAGLKRGKAKRLAGSNSIETANQICREGIGRWEGATAFVARNDDYKDALAIAPYAYRMHCPILMAGNGKTLTDSTIKTLKDAGIKTVYIVGGTSAVKPAVEAKLRSSGLTVAGRLAGSNSIDTSAKVAAFALRKGMSTERMAIATNLNYPDALAGAALCGRNGSVLVLCNDGKSGRSAIDATYKPQRANVGRAYGFGGSAVVSEDTWTYVNGLAKR